MSPSALSQQWTPAKKARAALLCGLILVVILISLPSPPPQDSSPPLRTNSITSPIFDSPEHALETLLAAYQSQDVEAIVAAKDFALDSQLFWEGLGLPTNEKQKADSPNGKQCLSRVSTIFDLTRI
ncbi:MAG: hypothetical protein K0Q55_2054 [Verrucomicrobia bacterium]|nr:hypothetical protein [Verrucomicrobiota bacterium]